MLTIFDLPDDVLGEIVSWLDILEAYSLTHVHRRFRRPNIYSQMPSSAREFAQICASMSLGHYGICLNYTDDAVKKCWLIGDSSGAPDAGQPPKSLPERWSVPMAFEVIKCSKDVFDFGTMSFVDVPYSDIPGSKYPPGLHANMLRGYDSYTPENIVELSLDEITACGIPPKDDLVGAWWRARKPAFDLPAYIKLADKDSYRVTTPAKTIVWRAKLLGLTMEEDPALMRQTTTRNIRELLGYKSITPGSAGSKLMLLSLIPVFREILDIDDRRMTALILEFGPLTLLGYYRGEIKESLAGMVNSAIEYLGGKTALEYIQEIFPERRPVSPRDTVYLIIQN